MDRRAPVAVAALALLLVVSTAGCVEVKDRPERGEFEIRIESPPILLTNSTGGWLHGPEAMLTTDLLEKKVEYSWDFNLDGVADKTGRDVYYDGDTDPYTLVSYTVSFYGQHRDINLFLVIIQNSKLYAATFFDTFFINESQWKMPPGYVDLEGNFHPYQFISVQPGPGLTGTGFMGGEIRFNEYDGARNLTINVSYDLRSRKDADYAVLFRPFNLIDLGPSQVSVVYRANETHTVTCDTAGRINITIWNSSAPDNISFSGPVSRLPQDRRTEPATLDWQGTVGGGKEEAPGPGALLASTSMVIVASAMAVRRSLRHATRRAS